MSEEIVRVSKQELTELIENKLHKAGLPRDHAHTVAEHLAYADGRGVHSHGAVRVEYYAERIAKGGSNANPEFAFEQTGPSTGMYDGDNAVGMVVALNGLHEAMRLAKESGIGVVGMKRLGHCGTLSYFLRIAAANDLVMLSVCQSDPMVVPYGGVEPYFGTNPIGFAAPRENGAPVVFDMATTVQAWGKVLAKRAKKESIPDTWAVDENGIPTTDPFAVRGLLPIAGAKGYGLMMMVDILCGSMLGQPIGKHVTSMYADLSEGRELGQLHILIDPSRFVDINQFKRNVTTMVDELHAAKAAPGFDQISYPGENSDKVAEQFEKEGIPIVKEIYDYLVSSDVHFDRYDHKNPFAS